MNSLMCILKRKCIIFNKMNLLLIILSAFTSHLQGSNNSLALDTIEYNVYVAADYEGVMHHGGTDAYRKKLNLLFDQVNDFWNSAGSGKFNFYFKYNPDLQVVYKCSSRQLEKTFMQCNGFTNYDVLFIIDSILNFEDEESGKGWYCSLGEGFLNTIVCRSRSNTEHEKLFDVDYFCRGIAHELGHYRGVTDLYADRILESKNPVNNIQYEPDSCVMNNHYNTYTWSDYAINIINHTAKSTRPAKDFNGFFRSMFPNNIRVSVDAKGKNVKDVTLNLYGSRARYNDLIPTPYKTYATDKNGECIITNIPALYDNPTPPLNTDDLPWNRWFSFVLEAEYKGNKKYVWLPEYEVQQAFFRNEECIEVRISF